MQEIALDCPPCTTRPDEHLARALCGTKLPIREAETKLFGCWTFNYADISADVWKLANPIIAQNIRTMYAQGVIRYGSWGTIEKHEGPEIKK